LGGEPFCVRYNRFFELLVDKNVSVAEICRLDWVLREEGGRGKGIFFTLEEEFVFEVLFYVEKFFYYGRIRRSRGGVSH
jgi:hypothetical protein